MKEALIKAKNELCREIDIQESLGYCFKKSCKGCKYYTDTGKILMYGEKPTMICMLSHVSSEINKILTLSERGNKQ